MCSPGTLGRRCGGQVKAQAGLCPSLYVEHGPHLLLCGGLFPPGPPDGGNGSRSLEITKGGRVRPYRQETSACPPGPLGLTQKETSLLGLTAWSCL